MIHGIMCAHCGVSHGSDACPLQAGFPYGSNYPPRCGVTSPGSTTPRAVASGGRGRPAASSDGACSCSAEQGGCGCFATKGEGRCTCPGAADPANNAGVAKTSDANVYPARQHRSLRGKYDRQPAPRATPLSSHIHGSYAVAEDFGPYTAAEVQAIFGCYFSGCPAQLPPLTCCPGYPNAFPYKCVNTEFSKLNCGQCGNWCVWGDCCHGLCCKGDEKCHGGVCRKECDTTADCPPDHICTNGVCIPRTEFPCDVMQPWNDCAFKDGLACCCPPGKTCPPDEGLCTDVSGGDLANCTGCGFNVCANFPDGYNVAMGCCSDGATAGLSGSSLGICACLDHGAAMNYCPGSDLWEVFLACGKW
jgi:hypothetical protein